MEDSFGNWLLWPGVCHAVRKPKLAPMEEWLHGFGRSPGGGHGNPLQYSCLENPTDRGAWQATAHRVT